MMRDELCVIMGILVGNFCHTPTALMFIVIWTIVRNPQLPMFMGGKQPQELVSDIIVMLYGMLMTLLFKRNSVRRATRVDDPLQSAVFNVEPDQSLSVQQISGHSSSVPIATPTVAAIPTTIDRAGPLSFTFTPIVTNSK